jgi:hypothetical protein
VAGVALEWLAEPGTVENSEKRIRDIQGGRRVDVLSSIDGRD